MKLIQILSLACLAFIFVSCGDDVEQVDRVAVDDQLILDYLSANNITATKHESGLYYTIEEEGSGSHPTASSIVSVDYKGYLLDGTVFEENTINGYSLSNFITGWKIGIPLLKKDGSGTFYIPSYYAYGSTSTGSIPSNSVLIFEIALNDFK